MEEKGNSGSAVVAALTTAVLTNPSLSSSLPDSLSSSGGGGLSRGQKIALLVTAALGITAVGFIAHYFRRPTRGGGRKKSSPNSKNNTPPSLKGFDVPDGYGRLLRSGGSTSTATLSPRGGGGGGDRLGLTLHPHGRSSITSSILTQSTLVSNSVLDLASSPGAGLTCTQLGILGMETLQKSVSFWEESLHLLKIELESGTDLNDDEENNLLRTIAQLEPILEAAKSLQTLAQDLYLDEASVLYAESDRDGGGGSSSTRTRLRSSGSVESFMSAEDWLSDDEDIRHSLENAGLGLSFLSGGAGEGFPGGERGDTVVYPLYEAALSMVKQGAVPYRSLKTEMVGCRNGDHEYLAKLHCLRGAFSRIISDVDKRAWITRSGKDVFVDILLKADKDPTDFEVSYDAIISWSQKGENWGLIDNELKDRGLRALTFYDIVLDYIFLDAFEDLESPPASVLAVTQNRWLSNSFKETALGTAVWSVLKTKRKWLRFPEGFMAHFYTLSEQIMPTLAWGFLGPANTIQELCFFFKDKFLEFLNSVFSFEDVRYTTLDELAEDVMKRLEIMHSLISNKIAEIPTPT